MVVMPYLLTIMVDLTSETCRTIVSYHAYKNEGKIPKVKSTTWWSVDIGYCIITVLIPLRLEEFGGK